MNFDLTDEQELLRDTAREVFARTYDTESRNKIVDSELGWSREVWRQLADIGILGLGFDPEESGQIEIMVVMTEIGRRLAPEPVATAALIPGGLIAEIGSGEQRALLDEVAAGERLLALAHTEKGLRGLDELSTRATKDGDRWTITGRKNPVLAGDSADVLVVTASLPEGGVGAFLVDAAATTRHPYRTFDGLRGAEIDFADSPAQQLGDDDVSDRIYATLIRYSAALCAEAVGAMDESLRLTTEYLNARKQFGVPLKTFQTLTQRAADMYVSLELARSMNYYAAMCITDGRLDPVVAARSKLQIGRSGRHISQESIQMHGGIGVTAEYPVAHYAARLTAIDQTLGSATDQLRFLSKQVGGYGVVTL
jgi:alkylation response protein AidB-like acyl-CoA dehydrogenase